MFTLALCLAVFETGLSQQETCQADVVVTSQGALKRQIKREIATAFLSFTCVCRDSYRGGGGGGEGGLPPPLSKISPPF